MHWLLTTTFALAALGAASAAAAAPYSTPNEYDADGRPWFQKYFEQGKVEEITGFKPQPGWQNDPKLVYKHIKKHAVLPVSYDLRQQHPSGHLQPIKRQACGDCWAHSTIAVLESDWMLKHPAADPEIYAQQELISCRNTGGSCNGGTFSAFDYVSGKSGPGLPMEADLPYQGHHTRCNNEVDKKPRASSWFMLGDRQSGPTIEEMKQAILDHGSLSVTVSAFNFTGDGIYSACRNVGINHMVNIEGWSDFTNDADKEKYHADGYWIMRNSWGESFGDGGYAKVAYTDRRGHKCAGLGTDAAVATVD